MTGSTGCRQTRRYAVPVTGPDAGDEQQQRIHGRTGDMEATGDDGRRLEMRRLAVGKGTVLAESAWLLTLFCVACGAGAGWLVTLLAKWLVTLAWAPLQGRRSC
ncbi:YqeB family protein [Streptomyces sp. Marseille-Q5077]|uniref:YqeB family protein n=1 Tax=Streptomyces sp. Marseille-Q5077 TaxID=3418995 RepID=UPI003CFBD5AE